MRLDFCAACGERDPDKLEHHHLVPRSAGGGDEETNLVTLCASCHGKVHGTMRVDVRHLTKKGLAAAKARGVRLGGDRGGRNTQAMRDAGVAALKAKARGRAVDIAPAVAEIQATGATSLRQIAAGLNGRGIPTARGGQWSAVQVKRMLEAA